MIQPESIKIRWVHDLCDPSRPGKWFTRYGDHVDVTAENFNVARAHLGAGATDVLFIAERVFPLLGEPIYVLKAFEIIT